MRLQNALALAAQPGAAALEALLLAATAAGTPVLGVELRLFPMVLLWPAPGAPAGRPLGPAGGLARVSRPLARDLVDQHGPVPSEVEWQAPSGGASQPWRALAAFVPVDRPSVSVGLPPGDAHGPTPALLHALALDPPRLCSPPWVSLPLDTLRQASAAAATAGSPAEHLRVERHARATVLTIATPGDLSTRRIHDDRSVVPDPGADLGPVLWSAPVPLAAVLVLHSLARALVPARVGGWALRRAQDSLLLVVVQRGGSPVCAAAVRLGPQ